MAANTGELRHPLPGGWRKQVYLIQKQGKKQIVCYLPREAAGERRLKRALALEAEVGASGIVNTRSLIELRQTKKYWRLIFTYLPGRPRWRWGASESFKVGQLLARLHQIKLAHLDIKPGNLLWNQKGEIVGLIDFEEAKKGSQYLLTDLANTLSWVLVSGGSEAAFLAGYYQGGGRIDRVKMELKLRECLKKRMAEGNHQAFLLLAKRRLAEYRKAIAKKILTQRGLAEFRAQHRGAKIVFLVGAFELLHWGHLKFLKRAKQKGDFLVIGVASDSSRRRLKGEIFPLVGERTRAETLAFFPFVDGVVVVEEDDVVLALKKLAPDVFYTAKKDWQEGVRKEEEARLVRQSGGVVIKAKHSPPGISSSKMVEQIALVKIRQVLFGRRPQKPLLSGIAANNKKIIPFGKLSVLQEKLRRQGKTIVFTSGSFDLFHLGHARFLQKAKSCGDCLVVGIPSNASVRKTKGWGRPIIDQLARAAVVAELGCVDWVVIFPQTTVLASLQKLKPDVFFTVKEEWNQVWRSKEARLISRLGGKIVRSPRQGPYISASKMIDKAAGELIKTRFKPLLTLAEKTPVLNADFDPYSLSSQLKARQKGFYQQVLLEVAQRGRCPFCELKAKYIIAEKKGIVLTTALFPYINGHLLVIPRRHLVSLLELNQEEWLAAQALVRLGLRLLREKLGKKNVWVLVREGQNSGKTVQHLHFHLIPFEPNLIEWHYQKITLQPQKLAELLRKGAG